MSTPQRTYRVARRDGTGPERLIKSPNGAQALRHVAADTLTVSVASQDDLERLLPAGVKVEKSGDAAQAEPTN